VFEEIGFLHVDTIDFGFNQIVEISSSIGRTRHAGRHLYYIIYKPYTRAV